MLIRKPSAAARMACLLVILAVLALPGCGSQSGNPASATSRAALDEMLKLQSDCLQYRVGSDSTGAELWNADYVYFYMLQGDQPAMDKDHRPIAQGLLRTQLKEFMAQHPEYGEDVQFTYRVSRQVQRVKDGKVLSTSAPVMVDADIDSLLQLAGRLGS